MATSPSTTRHTPFHRLPDWLTRREAGSYLGISIASVDRLPHKKFGKHVRIPKHVLVPSEVDLATLCREVIQELLNDPSFPHHAVLKQLYAVHTKGTR